MKGSDGWKTLRLIGCLFFFVWGGGGFWGSCFVVFHPRWRKRCGRWDAGGFGFKAACRRCVTMTLAICCIDYPFARTLGADSGMTGTRICPSSFRLSNFRCRQVVISVTVVLLLVVLVSDDCCFGAEVLCLQVGR